MQAQDYLGSLWAIGQRTLSSTMADVERAIADRSIVRTWPMRGTLHVVPAHDVRWMLELLTPRVLARNRARLKRDFSIDGDVLAKSRRVLERVFRNDHVLTRDSVYAELERAGIAANKQRGLHILWWLAQEGFVCLGPREGKQHTVVLLDDWIPRSRETHPEEARAMLAERFFRSHGPATRRDFAWWSGLPLRDATTAVESVCARLDAVECDGERYWHCPRTGNRTRTGTRVHLLPPFDEYTVAYKERASIIHPSYAKRGVVGFGIMSPCVLIDGKVFGTWGRKISTTSVTVGPAIWPERRPELQKELSRAVERYGNFLGLTAENVFP